MLLEGWKDACTNVAFEEAMFMNCAPEEMVLRVWDNQKAIVIGRAQLASFETDVDYCSANGIPIVRRFTGGGTVYHGPGNLNWSMVVGKDFDGGNIKYVWDVRQIFGVAGALVTEAIRVCGVDVRFEAPGNRIVSGAGKVSGMAAYLSKEAMFCHGTLLLHADLVEASKLTNPTPTNLERRYIRSNPMQVANTGIEGERFVTALSSVISKEAGASLERRGPTGSELATLAKLLPRYADPGWNLGDPFTHLRVD
ncbi:MAG: lipoate--protein ligase family protein [Thaumarchaeota archaeon]|nr:lipoate--protein ligase family protein [Nitrososphaerota archaeon]